MTHRCFNTLSLNFGTGIVKPSVMGAMEHGDVHVYDGSEIRGCTRTLARTFWNRQQHSCRVERDQAVECGIVWNRRQAVT